MKIKYLLTIILTFTNILASEKEIEIFTGKIYVDWIDDKFDVYSEMCNALKQGCKKKESEINTEIIKSYRKLENQLKSPCYTTTWASIEECLYKDNKLVEKVCHGYLFLRNASNQVSDAGFVIKFRRDDENYNEGLFKRILESFEKNIDLYAVEYLVTRVKMDYFPKAADLLIKSGFECKFDITNKTGNYKQFVYKIKRSN